MAPRPICWKAWRGESGRAIRFLGSGSAAVIHEQKGDLVLTRGKTIRIQSRGKSAGAAARAMEEISAGDRPGAAAFRRRRRRFFRLRHGADVLEELSARRKESVGFPDFAFLLTDTLLIFDNVSQKIKVVANAYLESNKERDVREAYRHATARIEKMIARLKRPAKRLRPKQRRKPITFTSNMSKADFEKMVVRTKEYIRAGDIVQAVLSQRWETQIHTTPFQLYRALRVINPSPYMYYLRIAGVELVGSSPETLVRCEDGKVSLRPIAGTRRRGQTPEEDEQLGRRLLADEKERAEHVMLVDLGRNDVGRVAKRGTVTVDSLMQVERYSHVMHIVSQVTGDLDEGKTSYDVLRACFPAGTVSGAPKIRAMQIIEELEPTRRGPYAGAVGYFSFSGNMDMCINIRTVVIKGRQAYIQAGAGIVADSNPEHEYEETCNKARAMMKAIEQAEQGLEEDLRREESLAHCFSRDTLHERRMTTASH
ncbi:MAG: anthranilate synthase component I [Nitrospiraceae bacterium]